MKERWYTRPFDDGPSENTGKILDILKKYNAKATFFVTGTNKGYNSNIKRAFDEGNYGLHTYTHKYSIYASEATYYDDLGKVSDMVQDITGVRTLISGSWRIKQYGKQKLCVWNNVKTCQVSPVKRLQVLRLECIFR